MEKMEERFRCYFTNLNNNLNNKGRDYFSNILDFKYKNKLIKEKFPLFANLNFKSTLLVSAKNNHKFFKIAIIK